MTVNYLDEVIYMYMNMHVHVSLQSSNRSSVRTNKNANVNLIWVLFSNHTTFLSHTHNDLQQFCYCWRNINFILPFVTLVCIIWDGEWWNNENNDWCSKRFTKFVHILGYPLITVSKKIWKYHKYSSTKAL